MDREALAEILQRLDRELRDGQDVGTHLCRLCTEAIGVAGTGILLMARSEPRGSLGLSDEVMRVIEDLQFTLGEGPSIDVHRTGRAVLEPELGGDGVRRWPVFAPLAIEAGAGAMFDFPLQVGAIRVGALSTYNHSPGELTDEQFVDGLIMADVVTHSLIAFRSQDGDGSPTSVLAAAVNLRAEVHQASGMIAAQLGIGIDEALVRLRAHSHSTGRSMNSVALDVVARTLQLE